MSDTTETPKPRLSRQQMARRLAEEFQDGWIVNLGTGMPTMCSDYVPADRTVVFHAENGVIGYGPRAATMEEASPDLTNAGGQAVTLKNYASFVHHADSFALVRRGLLSAAVLGAYEVGANGDIANWRLPGNRGGGIGGAMDIAACAQRVFAIMEHSTREGAPRLLPRCALDVTAVGVVTLVMTDLGLFEPTGDAFRILEIAPGFNVDEVAALTGTKLEVSPTLTTCRAEEAVRSPSRAPPALRSNRRRRKDPSICRSATESTASDVIVPVKERALCNAARVDYGRSCPSSRKTFRSTRDGARRPGEPDTLLRPRTPGRGRSRQGRPHPA